MTDPVSKLDSDLRRALDDLRDEDELDVLVHPIRMGGSIESFLSEAKAAGGVDYNVLELAGCIALKAPKRVILDVARRDDVARVSANPRFSAG